MQRSPLAGLQDEGEEDDDEEDDDEPEDLSDEGSDLGEEGKPGITTTGATLALMTCVIGAGVMALPQLPQRGGWVMCVIFLFLAVYCVLEAGLAFWKAYTAHNLIAEPGEEIRSYADYATRGGGKYGTVAATIVRAFIIFFNTGACVGYVILMSEQISNVAFNLVSPTTATFIMFPIMLALAMLPNVSAITKLVPLALGGAFVSIAIILLGSAYGPLEWVLWSVEDRSVLHRKWPTSFTSLGGVLATLFGAFATMSNVPGILSEMQEPAEFPRAWRLAMGGCALLYFLVMWFGYFGYGEFILPNVIDNLEFSPGSAAQAYNCSWYFKDWTGVTYDMEAEMASIGVALNLIISMPLIQQAVFISIQTCCPQRLGVGMCLNYIMRIGINVIIFGLALLVPNFSAMFALIAAICSPFLNCVFPFAFGYFIRLRTKKKTGWCRLALHAVIICLALACTVFGIIDSLGILIDGGTPCHYNETSTPGCNGAVCSPHLSETHQLPVSRRLSFEV